MALRFVDGFDHYGIANIGLKYSKVQTNPPLTPSVYSPGRFGGSCLQNYLYPNNYVGILIDQKQTWVVGMAAHLSIHNFAPISGPVSVIALYQNSPYGPQNALYVNPIGQLEVYLGQFVVSSPFLLGRSAASLPINTWNFIEYKCCVDQTIANGGGGTGYITVKVNGDNWISTGTNQWTQNMGHPYADVIIVGSDSASGFSNNTLNYALYDDLYICDTTGSKNNDFLGDCRVETLFPDGAGTNTQWAPSSGTNWQCVDDPQFDGESTYVSSNTTAQVDTYVMTSLSTSNTPVTVFGVQQTFAGRKADFATKTVSGEVISGATTSVLPPVTMTTSYEFSEHVMETDPNTGVAWTALAVNSFQTGVKNTS